MWPCFFGWERYQFQSLRHCVTGGEALTPDVREKWKSQTGLELHEGYGQSETVSTARPVPAQVTSIWALSQSVGIAGLQSLLHFWLSALWHLQGLPCPQGREVKLLSHVRLFATPWTVAHQAPPSMGFSRQEYWSGLPFPAPRDLPHPGIEPRSPTLHADALPSEPPGKSIPHSQGEASDKTLPFVRNTLGLSSPLF